MISEMSSVDASDWCGGVGWQLVPCRPRTILWPHWGEIDLLLCCDCIWCQSPIAACLPVTWSVYRET